MRRCFREKEGVKGANGGDDDDVDEEDADDDDDDDADERESVEKDCGLGGAGRSDGESGDRLA